jgi:hypothetical protein
VSTRASSGASASTRERAMSSDSTEATQIQNPPAHSDWKELVHWGHDYHDVLFQATGREGDSNKCGKQVSSARQNHAIPLAPTVSIQSCPNQITVIWDES